MVLPVSRPRTAAFFWIIAHSSSVNLKPCSLRVVPILGRPAPGRGPPCLFSPTLFQYQADHEGYNGHRQTGDRDCFQFFLRHVDFSLKLVYFNGGGFVGPLPARLLVKNHVSQGSQGGQRYDDVTDRVYPVRNKGLLVALFLYPFPIGHHLLFL